MKFKILAIISIALLSTVIINQAFAVDTTPPVISITVSEPIPIPETDLPFTLILNNVTGGGTTISKNDQSSINNQTLHQFVDVIIPSGSKVHAITLNNTGDISETVMGWYADGANLAQNLGIKISQLNDFTNQEEIQWTLNPPIIKAVAETPRFGWISNQTTTWLATGGGNIGFDSDEFFPTIPDPITNNGLSGSNLFQIITFEKAENFNPFDEYEFVTCIDDTDGDITRTLMTTVGTVDTSEPRTYLVDYTCTDFALNESKLQVAYIVKRTASGGTATIGEVSPVGGIQEVSSLSDIPPISVVPREPTEPPRRTLDEIFDLFSFLFEEVEPIPTLEVISESVTEIPPPLSQPTLETTSFIESIQNFFARLFG